MPSFLPDAAGKGRQAGNRSNKAMKTIRTSVPMPVRATVVAAFLASGLIAAIQAASAATSTESQSVVEGQAAVVELSDNAKAVTYWTSLPEGAVVVTTVDTVTAADTEDEQHAVVRLQSILQSGQVQEISVPLAIGEAQTLLRIERVGDQVTVSKVTQ
jgi:hypothetical protein